MSYDEMNISAQNLRLKQAKKIIKIIDKDYGHLTTPEIIKILEAVESYYLVKNGWAWKTERKLRCIK